MGIGVGDRSGAQTRSRANGPRRTKVNPYNRIPCLHTFVSIDKSTLQKVCEDGKAC